MATTVSSHCEFHGFQSPNTTQVPDELFDKLLTVLSHAELKVLLYIIRRTFGFKKDSDTISLSQMLHGITTKDGRILDHGTGLSKPSLLHALRGLRNKKIIITERRRSVEKGDEPTIYKLRFAGQEQAQSQEGTPPVVKKVDQGGGKETLPGGRAKILPTQQTVIQETERQETDGVVDVTTELEQFGITTKVATKLTKRYPSRYIKEKLVMAQEFVATGSHLVSQNPAGWLRRAIEEDYQPASLPKRQPQRKAGNQKKATPVRAVPKATEEKASFPADPGQQAITRGNQHPAQPIPPEKQKAYAATWDKVVEQIKKDLPVFTAGETGDRLAGTALIEVTETKATINVPHPSTLAWLERRLYSQIAKAMKAVVGKDVDLQFIACS